ncbi:21443_t:CDS:2, partial [Gigaspora rosea]
HVVSQDRVEPDKDKVITVQEYPTPTSLRQLYRFISLVSYYRHFIPQFATIAKPLHKLLEKEVEYDWTELQEKAFETLKTCLTTAPVLQYLDCEKPFYLHTNASGTGLGAVLAQKDEAKKEYSIAYASKSLTCPERNYAATELEYYAVVWALQKPALNAKELDGYCDYSSTTSQIIHDEVEILLWNDTDEERNDSGYEEEEWKIDLTNSEIEKEWYYHTLLTTLADKTERVITWATINGYQYEPHNDHDLENDTQFMNIVETYHIEIPPWGALATGLEFIENATKNKNNSIEPSFLFDQSWDMETS